MDPLGNILLTGANGLIGRKLLDRLTAGSHYQVIATSKGGARFALRPDHTTYIPFDITDESTAEEIFRKFKPGIVINSAALTQVDECEADESKCRKINVTAVEVLARLARQYHAFFLQLSTDFVFNGTRGPYREEDLADPVSVYGRSKADAERVLEQSGLDFAIVRTILVYGFDASVGRKNLVTWVIDSLMNGRRIRVVSDQIRTPTLAEDVAEGCSLILRKKASGVFHIGGRDTLSPYDMAIVTAKYFNLDENLIEKVTSAELAQAGKRPMITGLITDKAARTLGYVPHLFSEGLAIVKNQMLLS